MQIPKKVWLKYKTALAAVDQKAAAEMEEYIRSLGEIDSIPWSAVQYAAALTDVYGEAAGAAACEMYDATAEASGAKVKPAEMAELPKIGEVAKVVRGAFKNGSEKVVPGAVGRMVKQVGADTTLKNAQRDGAEFAWIPAGDTCAFCLTLASRGWQKISKKSLKNGHAEHIHANCDCAYCVRFDKNTTVEGYEPEKYREMYDNAEGETSKDKINSMRREGAKMAKTEQKSLTSMIQNDKINNTKELSSLSIYHNSSEKIFDYAKDIKPVAGYEDIFIHGGPDGFSITDSNGNESDYFSPREFAEILKEDPNYHGGPIRLFSCQAGADGGTAAQSLANLLHVDVLAPSDDVWLGSEGYYHIGSNGHVADGEWRLFTPKELK